MSHLVKPPHESIHLMGLLRDYMGYVKPFIKSIDKWYYLPPFLALKTMEYSIYKWYEPRNESWRDYKYELIFQITSRCTDRCLKCGIWKKPEKSRVSTERIIHCINSISGNLRKVTITGGEPLLYMDDVVRLCKTTADIGIPMTIVTNGYLITDEFLRTIKDLSRNIVVSIDTLDESKWSQFRGRDHFRIVKENLNTAVDIVGERLSIQSVLAQETVDELPKIADFCRENGIRHYVQEYQDFGGLWHAAIPAQQASELQIPCSAWLNICVYPNGDVVKCFDHVRIPDAKEPLGNIGSKNIESILESPRAAEIAGLMKRCNLPCKELRCNQK